MKHLSLLVLLLVLVSCSQKSFKSKWTEEQAPDVFTARFETTKGNFDIRAERAWSPKAVDRLYQLIKHEFYTDIALFRVVPGFVVQFGINSDSLTNKQWSSVTIPDEEVKKKNTKGTIAFARAGKETRTTQLFINLKSNSPYLDELKGPGVTGFPVVAEVTEGMDVVLSFYDEYGNEPATKQDSIYARGNDYLKRNYPKIDYIKQAYLLKD
jgi:cyclophilin family peptidyl-prolyl cis-trans isomerase